MIFFSTKYKIYKFWNDAYCTNKKLFKTAVNTTASQSLDTDKVLQNDL